MISYKAPTVQGNFYINRTGEHWQSLAKTQRAPKPKRFYQRFPKRLELEVTCLQSDQVVFSVSDIAFTLSFCP